MLAISEADGDVYGIYARGANAYVVKPVSLDGMVEAMRTLTAFWVTLNSTVHTHEHLAREAASGVCGLSGLGAEAGAGTASAGPLLS